MSESVQGFWVRQFVVIWLGQLLSIASFSFGLPFVAYHMQDLGVKDPDEVLFLTSIFHGVAPLAFCVAAPFWEVMADRYGRKMMLVRSYLGAALVLWGMAWSPSVMWLIVFRVGQGLFTGTMTASQTLMAVSTPEQRHGLALGSLSAAVSGGVALGMTLGGYTAEHLGYAEAFFVGGCLSLASALLVGFFAVEKKAPPVADRQSLGKGEAVKRAWPLLVLIALCSLASHIDTAVWPLLVQKLNGGVEGAAAILGSVGALASLAGIFAGTVWGMASDRWGSVRIGLLCSVLAALLCLPYLFAESIGISPLYPAAFAMAFVVAGLDPVFQVWLSRNTLAENRGAIFGFAFTARSLGWAAGPMMGSSIAASTTLTNAYFGRMAGFLLLIPVVWWAGARVRRYQQEKERS